MTVLCFAILYLYVLHDSAFETRHRSVFGFVQISRTGAGCRPASTMARAAANASPPQQHHHHDLRRNLYTSARQFLGTAIPQRGELVCSSATAVDQCTHPRARRSTSAALTVALLSCSWSGSAGAQIPSGWTVGGGSRGSRSSQSAPLSVASSLSAGGAAAAAPASTAVGDGVAAIKPPVIFVLGGPGSGKGTQCERLAKDFG